MGFSPTVEAEQVAFMQRLLEDAIGGSSAAQTTIKGIILASRTAMRRVNVNPAEIGYVSESFATPNLPGRLDRAARAIMDTHYAELPLTHTKFSVKRTVRSTAPQQISTWLSAPDGQTPTTGGRANQISGLAHIPEGTGFPTIKSARTEQFFSAGKFGNSISFTLEALLNDEWDHLGKGLLLLGQRARVCEELAVLAMLATPSGPNGSTFSVAKKNVFTVAAGFSTNNPGISAQAISEVKTNTSLRKYDGNYVSVSSWVIVCAPELAQKARDAVAEQSYDEVVGGVTYHRTTSHPDVEIVTTPYIKDIDKSANVSTTWYMVPSTSGVTPIRESLLSLSVAGFETPELRVMDEGGRIISGGNQYSEQTSFYNDTLNARIRHFTGGAAIATETMTVSLGTNIATLALPLAASFSADFESEDAAPAVQVQKASAKGK